MTKKESFDTLDNAEALFQVTNEKSPLIAGYTTHLDKSDKAFDIHFELEIGIVLSGKMKRFWDDCTRIYNPGDVWLTGMWEPHGYSLIESPVKVLVFLFRPELLSSISLGSLDERDWFALFKAPPLLRPQINASGQKQILDIISLSFENKTEIEDNTKTRLSMLLILDKILEDWQAPSKSKSSNKKMNSIEPALELVFKSKGIVSTSQASSACALSDSTFERYFNSLTGMGFSRFALNHRLKHTAFLLRKSDLPIKAISDEWGFSDLSHFYKSFKKVFKLTPADYRESHISDRSIHKKNPIE